MQPNTENLLRVLAVGDVIGRPGRRLLERMLPRLKAHFSFDISVVNVENAAGGFGMLEDTYREFLGMGVDIMTSGNHIYDKKGGETWMDDATRMLVPANWPPGAPGLGYNLFDCGGGQKLAVMNLIGRTFMRPYDCPFRTADNLLPAIRELTPLILVDFHAEATSEKTALGWHLSKRISALWGTHTHVPTADARILDGHTGYQTDLGMTGAYDSVIGMIKEPVIEGFLSQNRLRFEVAKGDCRLGGCLLDLDRETGACVAIKNLFLTEDDLETAASA
ncbi:TIGR00282 family metallophosphoesterase [Acanthopleuribacter pedis]|uniref:YmdB family metallophosphoesterase n=1 Tax=Acanthopleuribacter pedis TaxID=442870 RepID=A0A8J7U792_9BACT|nr:TIGR00282 family metallophosphoesterase [Acanthopleuribacter pedis]MBO1322258.1 YmdB family metallophosphoesterase [Acanthopleuribacter pedis]